MWQTSAVCWSCKWNTKPEVANILIFTYYGKNLQTSALWIWRDHSRIKIFGLYVVEPGSIPNILYSSPIVPRNYPWAQKQEHSQVRPNSYSILFSLQKSQEKNQLQTWVLQAASGNQLLRWVFLIVFMIKWWYSSCPTI